jgi:hypothetical protein
MIFFLIDGYGSGDPHYRTFDGKTYDFQGKCEYIFTKDCSKEHAFEVLQQNEPCGRGTVSCTKSLRILTQNMEIRMERGGIVYVDGIRVHLPWTSSTPTLPPQVPRDVMEFPRTVPGNCHFSDFIKFFKNIKILD